MEMDMTVEQVEEEAEVLEMHTEGIVEMVK